MAAAGFYSEELIYLVLLCLTSSISYIFICKITFSVKSYQIWLKSVVKLSIKIVITLAYVVILKIKKHKLFNKLAIKDAAWILWNVIKLGG